jgi:hypothetical protein
MCILIKMLCDYPPLHIFAHMSGIHIHKYKWNFSPNSLIFTPCESVSDITRFGLDPPYSRVRRFAYQPTERILKCHSANVAPVSSPSLPITQSAGRSLSSPHIVPLAPIQRMPASLQSTARRTSTTAPRPCRRRRLTTYGGHDSKP